AWSLDHVGLLARSVADCRVWLSAVSGFDPDDPDSDPAQPPLDLTAASDLSPRVGLTAASDLSPRAGLAAATAAAPRLGLVREALQVASPRARENAVAMTARFESAGAQVREVSLGEPLE